MTFQPSDLKVHQSKKALRWQQAEAADPSKPSRLVNLAPELRAMILEHLLHRRRRIHKIRERTDFWGEVRRQPGDDEVIQKRDPRLLDTEIMRTCRQLHSEAAHVFYTRNTFRLGDSELLDSKLPGSSESTLVPALHPAYAPLVRRVLHYIDVEDDVPQTANELIYMLKNWPNVKLIKVVMSRATLGDLIMAIFAGEEYIDSSMIAAATTRLIRDITCMLSIADVKVPADLDIFLFTDDDDEHEVVKEIKLLANGILLRALEQAALTRSRRRS